MFRLAKRLFAVSFAAAAALAVMAPAQAVVYRGTWDPAYGPALPNLGWRGEAFFEVADACLGQGDGLYFNNVPGACSSQSILSGKVEFYNLATPATTLETLTFDASDIDITIAMRVTNHQLTGVIGGFLLPEESFISLTDTLPGVSHSIFWLGFQDDKARLANCQYSYVNFGCSVDKPRSSSDTPFLNLTPVPEAEGYTLALAGLVVVGFAMSRRRRTPSTAALPA
ncbi:MAG: hypothetical protein M9915_17145 [Rhizobacter sp.]|nr:hypothetical protein [Burkholderiaceae bacterium]MCO5125450.1 hypothetical protein [Rhizobacter sp.]